ncbi:MAG: YbaK/EbsC family protein [Cellulomonas sp.]
MTDLSHLPARSRVVAAALTDAGVQGDVVELPDSARTAAEAAAAVGVDVGAIANSLVFWADDHPLLVLTSGRHRVDTAALARRLGKAHVGRATPEQVRSATGQAIGGVAPVGHPGRLETVVDVALADYPQVWAAGGTPHTVFPTTFDELVRITGGAALVVGD